MTDATTNLVIGSGIVIGIGSIVNEKMPNMKLIFAGATVAIGLSVLDNVQPNLAAGFAGIIFIGLAAKYLPDAIDKLGFGNGGSGTNIDPKSLVPTTDSTSATGATGPVNSAFHAFTPTVPVSTAPTTTTATQPASTGGIPITFNLPAINLPTINVGGVTI